MEKVVLQTVLLAVVVGFHDAEFRNFKVKIHALFNTRITSTEGLYLSE